MPRQRVIASCRSACDRHLPRQEPGRTRRFCLNFVELCSFVSLLSYGDKGLKSVSFHKRTFVLMNDRYYFERMSVVARLRIWAMPTGLVRLAAALAADRVSESVVRHGEFHPKCRNQNRRHRRTHLRTSSIRLPMRERVSRIASAEARLEARCAFPRSVMLYSFLVPACSTLAWPISLR